MIFHRVNFSPRQRCVGRSDRSVGRVGPSVGQSVGPPFGRSVGRSVGSDMRILCGFRLSDSSSVFVMVAEFG